MRIEPAPDEAGKVELATASGGGDGLSQQGCVGAAQRAGIPHQAGPRAGQREQVEATGRREQGFGGMSRTRIAGQRSRRCSGQRPVVGIPESGRRRFRFGCGRGVAVIPGAGEVHRASGGGRV
jgi:hypothetical protein